MCQVLTVLFIFTVNLCHRFFPFYQWSKVFCPFHAMEESVFNRGHLQRAAAINSSKSWMRGFGKQELNYEL